MFVLLMHRTLISIEKKRLQQSQLYVRMPNVYLSDWNDQLWVQTSESNERCNFWELALKFGLQEKKTLQYFPTFRRSIY